jgi:hypothetical protein
MTDTLNVTGELTPADTTSMAAENAVTTEGVHTPETVQADVPNGFVELGLAPELVKAVGDLGYTQPTTVQLKTIPLALPSNNGEAKQGFIDLMVSSKTGSGKTAAFLLPVLHTLLKQQAEAEAADRAEYERSVADAIAKGEEPPKKAKRKDPTNVRNFKAPTPGALIVCLTFARYSGDWFGIVSMSKNISITPRLLWLRVWFAGFSPHGRIYLQAIPAAIRSRNICRMPRYLIRWLRSACAAYRIASG